MASFFTNSPKRNSNHLKAFASILFAALCWISVYVNSHGIEYAGIYVTELLGVAGLVLGALYGRDVWRRMVSVDLLLCATVALAAVFALLGMLCGLAAYAMREGDDRRMVSADNVHQVALAMLDYQTAKGRLPAWAVHDDKGRPLLSWRVLLLPYLEQQDLYRQFHQDEPWDSPHNMQLLSRIPPEYKSARSAHRTPEAYDTFIHVFVGKGAAFEGTTGSRIPADFPDGPAETILVLEGGEPVPWTKPEDIPYAADQPLPELATVYQHRFFVAMADGSVRTIDKEMSEKTVRAAITRNGNDVLGPDW
jgi:hypothetical protein